MILIMRGERTIAKIGCILLCTVMLSVLACAAPAFVVCLLATTLTFNTDSHVHSKRSSFHLIKSKTQAFHQHTKKSKRPVLYYDYD